MTKAQQILELYEQLPREERMQLREMILADDGAEMTPASQDEILRRVDAFHNGTSKGIVVEDLNAFLEAEAERL